MTSPDHPSLARPPAFPVSQLVVALAAAALGALMVIQGWGRPFFIPGRGTGPLAFPLVVGLVLLAMGVLLATRTLLGRDRPGRVAWPTGAGRAHLLGYLLLSVIYVLLVSWLGFFVANLLVGVACLRLLGGYAWWRAALLTVVLAVGLTLVFEVALNVTLPRGLVSF
jgi:putative tricarboxylic transport membrane protein